MRRLNGLVVCMLSSLWTAMACLLFATGASAAEAQAPSAAASQETGFLRRSLALRLTTIDYRVYVPADYDPARKYPVILYLHGRGARGNDNERQIGGAHLGSVIQLYEMKQPERYRSFIAVFPQTQGNWFGEPAEQAILALDQVMRDFSVDPQRVYLAGLSLGGYGCWYLAAKYPDKFAAVVQLSGGVVMPSVQPLAALKPAMPDQMFQLYSAQDPYAAFARAVGKTPVWIFHGARDDTIDVREGRNMNAALRAAGGVVRYTEYPEEGHFIADRVFTDAELWTWLMAQKLVR